MLRLEILRNVNDAEFAAVHELLVAAERADGHRALSDHLWLDLRQGGRAGFAAVVGTEAGHDHPVAYSQVSRGNDSWSIDVVVHPHHRYDMAAIGPEMMSATLDIVRQEGGGHVHWWVFEPTSIHFDLAERMGLQPGRELMQMRRSLPLPDAIAHSVTPFHTRSFVPGVDEDAWLRVNNAAFASHAEQGGWNADILKSRMMEPWFNPEGFRIHDVDGNMAGFCWTKMHDSGTHLMGEIYVIAVDPTFVGHGFGSLLTIAGLESLAAHGATEAMLYVDCNNTVAVAMYEKLGFTPRYRERAFVGDIHEKTKAS